MPAPSSQNLRSAPQKQPSANTACSRPAGYGGCSLRPLTKWVVAVGVVVARLGSASAALGNAVVLRMNNMDYLQAVHWPNGIRRRPGDPYIGLFTPVTAASSHVPVRSAPLLVGAAGAAHPYQSRE